ncbi:YaaC family protein [Cobetia sp. 1AS1]|uniref:YaaC family protein n=1 Tax=Cobetia sp. 1AS1 TaxID=3040016 RepID=UPI00244BD473|nr:YaaC family protein [Cobetia sp. 1AS1]MDH2293153.1 YaaC family protein [Cobetia sp. 1AS1]
MPTYRQARRGKILKVKKRPINYSRHTVVKRDRRFGLQTRVFATNPWSIIRGSIATIQDGSIKNQANSFVAQAEDFYRAYQSAHETSSKPLLVYYSLLNLAKAFVLFKGVRTEYDKAHHGLQETIHPDGVEFENSFLKSYKSRGNQVNIFSDFVHAFTGSPEAAREKVYDLKNLHPQILQGHRLWADAYEAKERFIEIERIDFFHDNETKKIWMVLNIYADDLSRFGISRTQFLKEGCLRDLFHHIKSEENLNSRLLLKFEQTLPLTYTGRPSDKLEELTNLIKNRVWSSVLRMPPYRKNYAYLSPEGEKNQRLPQVMSIYAFIYYLGSVTRYRPYFFEDLLERPDGAHIEETITNIPQQFLFLIASEFAGREVAHAPIV